MYTVEGYGAGGLWKTTNAGVDWDQVLPVDILNAFSYGGQIDGVAIDPTDHEHLVVESHGNAGATGICAVQTCLAESTDAGRTWKRRSIPRLWGENSSVAILDRSTWLYCTLFDGMFRTTDQGQTWDRVPLPNGSNPSCNVYNPYVYRDSGGRYYVPSVQTGILRSAPHDSGTWTFLANSPTGTTILPAGANLIVSDQWHLVYKSSPLDDLKTWTQLPSPSAPDDHGGVYLAYDNAHRILYSVNYSAGLWQIGAP
jgi:hypothetical protein